MYFITAVVNDMIECFDFIGEPSSILRVGRTDIFRQD